MPSVMIRVTVVPWEMTRVTVMPSGEMIRVTVMPWVMIRVMVPTILAANTYIPPTQAWIVYRAERGENSNARTRQA